MENNKSYWEVWKIAFPTDSRGRDAYYKVQEEWDEFVQKDYDKIVSWVDDFKYFDDYDSAREYFNRAKNHLKYHSSRVLSGCTFEVLLLVETYVRSDDEAFDEECDFNICDEAFGKKYEKDDDKDDDAYWEVWLAWVYTDEEDYYKAWAKWEDFTEKFPQKIPNEITTRYSDFDDEESARKFFDYSKDKIFYRLASDGEKFMYEVLMLVQTYTSADVDEMDEDDFDIIEWDIAKVYSSPQKKWWQKNTKKI